MSESIKGTGAEASKEANKNVAKDSDANVKTRATAAKDALVDKKDEVSHNTQADANKGGSESDGTALRVSADGPCRGCQALSN